MRYPKGVLMKKLLASLSILAASAVHAGPHNHGHIGGHNVWPLVIGGTIGYVIGRQTQPVYNNYPPVYNLPHAPRYGATPIYERRTQWDPNCNCYVVVYNQIGWQ
jgi:hypothetical protein